MENDDIKHRIIEFLNDSYKLRHILEPLEDIEWPNPSL